MANDIGVQVLTPSDFDADYQHRIAYRYHQQPLGVSLSVGSQNIVLMSFEEAARIKDVDPTAVRQLIQSKLQANGIGATPDDQTVKVATNAINNVRSELATMSGIRRGTAGGTEQQENAAQGMGDFGNALQPALNAYDQAQGLPPMDMQVGGNPSLRAAVQGHDVQVSGNPGFRESMATAPAQVAGVGIVHDRNHRIAEVQQELTEAGYHPGAIDNIRGKHTNAAIRSFAVDHGLKSGSNLTPEFMKELDEAVAAARRASVSHASEASRTESFSPKNGQGQASSQPPQR